MPNKNLADLLGEDEVRGRIIKDAAFMDFLLMIIVGMYFTPQERSIQFYELIGDRLSFNDKIEVFRRINFKRRYKSLECIKTIQKLRRLRNAVAHQHFVTPHDKLFLDNELKKMLEDWPQSYEREVKLAIQRLYRIGNTKEFLHLHTDGGS